MCKKLAKTSSLWLSIYINMLRCKIYKGESMRKILEHDHKFGACNGKGEPIILTIYDSIEDCGDFIELKVFELYLLCLSGGKLLF